MDRNYPKHLADLSVYPELLSTRFLLYKIVDVHDDIRDMFVIKHIIMASFNDSDIRKIRNIVGSTGNIYVSTDINHSVPSIYSLTIDSDSSYEVIFGSVMIRMVTKRYLSRRMDKSRYLVLIDLDAPREPTTIDLQELRGYVVVLTGDQWNDVLRASTIPLIVGGMWEDEVLRVIAESENKDNLHRDDEIFRKIILDLDTIFLLKGLL